MGQTIESHPVNEHVLLAKQPIYNKDLSLFGFELLFRNPLHLNALEVGEDVATSEVLVNYCTSISNEIERHEYPLFINVSESFLLSEAFLPIDKGCVVIELLERIKVTPELVAAVKSWHQQGYRFALDDYDFEPCWDPLLEFVEFIKVDILEGDLDDIAKKKALVSTKKNVLWIAERIEQQYILDLCMEMGFELFQGYVLARPKELLGNAIRPSSAVTAEIIKKSSLPTTEIAEIANLVGQDPKLTMQLLKLINSSLFTLPREIHDLKEAITFLGIDLLKQWALMIAFVSDAEAPIESCRIILIRAKCCELWINERHDSALAATAFLAGLISGVDLLLALEPKIFIDQVQLSPVIRSAILEHSGPLGEAIQDIQKIEYLLTQKTDQTEALESALLQHYSQAQHWAGQIIQTLQSSQ